MKSEFSNCQWAKTSINGEIRKEISATGDLFWAITMNFSPVAAKEILHNWSKEGF